MTKRRASMREGPLADLFRATQSPQETPPEPAPPAEPPVEAASPAPEPASEPAPQPHLQAVPGPDEVAPAPRETHMPYTPARDASSYLAMIRVVGVGGAGLNAVSRMMEAEIQGVEFVAVNTDVQQLAMSEAPVKMQLGRELTRGLGSGADSEVGRRAAEGAVDRMREILRGSDLVFVAAGEGGGTGTGAAPIVARVARELGALTIGIVTTPFRFEGTRRKAVADDGMARLQAEVDTLITVPNDRLLEVLEPSTSMVDAFRVADDVLRQGVQGICDLITRPGLINLDFADVRAIMERSGSALMGIGMATGPDRGADAAKRAIDSPLLSAPLEGATGIILSIAGGEDLGLLEITQAADVVRAAAVDNANIIFGATVDPELTGQLWVTVIATGFPIAGEAGARFMRPVGGHTYSRDDDDVDIPPFLRDR